MVEISVNLDIREFNVKADSIIRATRNALEAMARRTRNELRSYWLDAPEGFSPDRLHRRTGLLADTSFITDEPTTGSTIAEYTITFPMEYAIAHHGEGTRNVFVQPFQRNGEEMLRQAATDIYAAVLREWAR